MKGTNNTRLVLPTRIKLKKKKKEAEEKNLPKKFMPLLTVSTQVVLRKRLTLLLKY